MARTRRSEPSAASNNVLVAWAVAGPTIGLLAGLLIGYMAWSGGGGREPPAPGSAARPAERPAAKPKVPSKPEPAPARATGRAAERGWLEKRGLPPAELVYLFSEAGKALSPLGGSLADEKCLLAASGPVRITADGALFRDGGKLLSLEAGKALARRIKAAGRFSVETLAAPADARHGGPARIISLSYDGNVRNFTLAQQGEQWVVRLRTSRTGANGTSPEVSAGRLYPKWTHVVVTYDGKVERIYLDGREAKSSTEVAGSLESWNAEKYPLVMGNEAYDPRNWAGAIKFAAFYSRALSAEEVRKALKDLPPGSKTTSPAPVGAQDIF